ncbi:hypothetical protein [Actinoplanes subtropicus]|uniref:hypothetical protein n=1 Tax=Actinoplanes subtropicus TaxID=543632 RepID=UPI0004C3DB8D|nr:hypothetical protein [Actinoplanes subtropicus]
MNGWSVLLLLADLAAVIFGVVVTLRGRSAGAEPVVTRAQLAEVAMTGALIFLIALAVRGLGLVGVSALVGMSVTVGRALRISIAFAHLGRYHHDAAARRYFPWAAAGTGLGTVVVLVGVVSAGFGAPRHTPTEAERDSTDLGIKVFDHAYGVPSRVLDRQPVLADVGSRYVVAVPVIRYRVDGDALRLVVAHDLTCVASTVLLAADDGALDVLVGYRPSGLTPTGSPDPASSDPDPSAPGSPDPDLSGSGWTPPPTDATGPLPVPNARTCQPGPPAWSVVNTVIEVTLPAGLAPSPAVQGAGAPPAPVPSGPAVHDVGAHGAASPVPASPTS